MLSNIRISNIPLGISLSISEVIFTIIIASLVKLISTDLSVFMILFFRYLFCIPLLLLMAIFQRGKEAMIIKSKLGLTLRTLAGIGSFGCLFAALQFINLSLMTILLQTMPLFITILAPLLINEVVGWFRRITAIIGFIGVMLILNPGNDGWIDKGVVLGMMSPFFGALMVISVRRLGKTDHPASTALWYNILGALIFLFICILNEYHWPFYGDILLILIVIGIVSSFQQICLAYSYKLAPASLLAPLRYISVPIGIIVGIFFFNETLSSNFFIGTLIIIICSIIIIVRENKLFIVK